MTAAIFEGDGLVRKAAFFEDGVPFVPSTIHWRVLRESDEYVLQDWTAVPTPDTEVTITVPGSVNYLVDESARRERHLLVVVADMGLELAKTQVHPFDVRDAGP